MSYNQLLSLLPPLIVLTIGYITKRVILSLVCGILLAAFIASDFSIYDTIILASESLWANLNFNKLFSINTFWHSYNFFVCIFLLCLGIFVTLLQHSGGAYAYQNYIRNYVRTKKQAEVSSLILSVALFIDDYFSSLTVGSVMYPITDANNIPRAKLSFLVDSMAAPLAILCPFSSWVAAILGFLKENGVSNYQLDNTLIIANPLTAYFSIIPFIFYSFILIFGVWFIVLKRISFGLMYKHEQIAFKTGNLTGNKPDPFAKQNNIDHNPKHTTLVDFFTPIGILLICVLLGMLYSGDWILLGGNNNIIAAFQNSSAAVGLFLGGSVALNICIIFFLIRKRIEITKLLSILWEGIKLMLPAVIVLMLAWSLGDLLRYNLHTGEYIASFMLGSVNLNMLPAILFFASALIAFAIGSSWGTAAMVFPIAIPLVISLSGFSTTVTLEQIPMLFPSLGAVLSGCVAGDHLSPISDTTIMSATSTRTIHMDHVRTQITLVMPMFIMTGLSFLIVGYLIPYGTMVAINIPILFGVISSMIWLLYKNKNKASV